MFQWLSDHSQILNLLVNIGMLIVWSTYLQVFLGNYRRQTRPKILIVRGAGSGLGARCLISNMSAEAIHIDSIVAALEWDAERLTCAVTDLEDLEGEQVRNDPRQGTRQGPLASGSYMDLGSFQGLLQRVLRGNGRRDDVVPERLADRAVLEICIIANYGSETLPVGGKRRFDLAAAEAGMKVQPQRMDTEQIVSRRKRRQIEGMLQAHG